MDEKAFRQCQGRGTVTYPDDDKVDCAFTATQREDGDVELSGATETPGIPAGGWSW